MSGALDEFTYLTEKKVKNEYLYVGRERILCLCPCLSGETVLFVILFRDYFLIGSYCKIGLNFAFKISSQEGEWLFLLIWTMIFSLVFFDMA